MLKALSRNENVMVFLQNIDECTKFYTHLENKKFKNIQTVRIFNSDCTNRENIKDCIKTLNDIRKEDGSV